MTENVDIESRENLYSNAVCQHIQTLKKRGIDMNKNIEKKILEELNQIESEHKDDEDLKQSVKRIKYILGL